MSSVKGNVWLIHSQSWQNFLNPRSSFQTSRGYREFHWVLLLFASGLARRDGLESHTFWKDLIPMGAVFPSCFLKPCWDGIFSP